MSATKAVPKHVAIIMDGNGRWAKRRFLPKIAGHRQGAKSVDEITEAARETGVKVLTLYTFSTENWKRPQKEIDALFGLLEDYLDSKEEKLNRNNIRLAVSGKIDGLPGSTQLKLRRVMDSTAGNDGMILNLALNYGSRAEIVEAVRSIARKVKDGQIGPEEIDEKLFSGFLYTKDLPDPDILIRTSGEMRLSNFLLWQMSYAEIYVTKKLWPDFGKRDFRQAIAEFQGRERRFGG